MHNNERANLAQARIEISGGIVTASKISDHHGTHQLQDEVGELRFFVVAVEHDGGRLGLWDGSDYGAAILNAYELASNFGAPVVDLVVSGGDEPF